MFVWEPFLSALFSSTPTYPVTGPFFPITPGLQIPIGIPMGMDGESVGRRNPHPKQLTINVL
jgi:hypothetical protein